MNFSQLEEKLASGGMRAFLFRWPQFNEQNEQWSILVGMLERIFGVELHLSPATHLPQVGFRQQGCPSDTAAQILALDR